ncbi:hypothetical protein [Psychroserpens mesophilus]|uniref:hypothetical protein n=1 Tax=Psychroserpens mesophilus TaxID=325473 RepID=UPI0005906871|nr:hypothetical protein [Psychroserpens mesophilus]
MKNPFYIFILLITFNLSSQEITYHRVKEDIKSVTITPHDNGTITMYKITGLFDNANEIIYLDTINNYKVFVPKWLELQETNNLFNFGSTIPRKNGVDNAICINSAPKNNFASFTDFKNLIIENPDYLNENDTSWIMKGSKLISYEKEVFQNHNSYKVRLIRNDKSYLGQFIIIETKKSYLWINFIADELTYESDIEKFGEFIKTLEVLN